MKKKKAKEKKIFKKNAMNISFVFVFMIVFARDVTGRTGFINYFIRNPQGMEAISNRGIEKIQKEIDREYETLEKEHGVKFGKINLPSNKYIM